MTHLSTLPPETLRRATRPAEASRTLALAPPAASALALQPAPDSREVACGTALSVRFSAPLDVRTLPGAFTLLPRVPGTLSLSADGLCATFTPVEPLAPATRYQAALSAEVRSEDGCALAAAPAWSFCTAG
jgi:hypothetical protein